MYGNDNNDNDNDKDNDNVDGDGIIAKIISCIMPLHIFRYITNNAQ